MVELETAELDALSDGDGPVEFASTDETPTAAHARLGAEGVQRLRARYAEVLARISERITDPVRRDQLKAEAERLNPDTWVTADEVTAGLDQYEVVFERLRAAVGSRRRRRRRTGADAGTGPDTESVTRPREEADAFVGSEPEAEAAGPEDEGGAD
ncbi:MAG TPA: hypothetical protein VD833_00140 [Vicinamibacterales bacterium]|nr:hypothetical protein [Vicinamibacterales bacterium]